MSFVLETVNLSKNYKQNVIVDNINIHLKKGEIYGFIGQNGAGKTTTIRMILNLLRPTNGSVQLFGEECDNKNIYKHLRKIGAIIETPGFYLNLTAIENLDIHRIMMNVTEKTSIDNALQIVGLQGEGNKKVCHYSLGMKQRLGIARALLHDPDLLILDEPTNGLDPQGITEIRDLIVSLANQGKTIFLSSHILSEVERIVSRIGIIHRGKLLEEINKIDFEEKCRTSFLIKVNKQEETIALLKNKMNIQDAALINGYVTLKLENEDNNGQIISLLVENKIQITESKVMHSSLEDYFMEMTKGVEL